MATDDAPLYIDPAYGARTWRINRKGILTGLFYAQPWLPGVNIAQCRKGEQEFAAPLPGAHPFLSRFAQKQRPPVGWKPEPIRREGHLLAECKCGFHAFTEGSIDYGYRNNYPVSGVVKLYGLTVPGTHGARAEKAEIIALHIRPMPIVDPANEQRVTHMGKVWENLYATPEMAAKVRANYSPAVAFFETFEDMVAAYPVAVYPIRPVPLQGQP